MKNKIKNVIITIWFAMYCIFMAQGFHFYKGNWLGLLICTLGIGFLLLYRDKLNGSINPLSVCIVLLFEIFVVALLQNFTYQAGNFLGIAFGFLCTCLNLVHNEERCEIEA